MAQLVSLAELKMALHIDHADDDALLNFYIAAASEKVRDYLKDRYTIAVPDEANAPDAIKLAVIFLVGIVVQEPDGNQRGEWWSQGNLPQPFMSLLYQYRDPAVR